jgi:hypothetical protein
MLRRGLPAVVTGLALLTTTLAGPSYAGTNAIVDNGDYDVPHRDIDMHKLKVTYDAKGVRATLSMKDLRKRKRLRIFVAFTTRPSDDPFAPVYGNFVEFRLNAKGKKRVVNWVINPALTDYTPEKCAGVKVKPNYDRDKLKYKVPNRCIRFDLNRGYVDSYASARKYTPGHYDEGSPANSTGDWFDTTYDLRTPR